MDPVERLSREVQHLRSALAESEMEEELHVNTLLRSVHTLKKEKIDLSLGLERETEFVLHRMGKEVRQAQTERDVALRAAGEARAEGAARVRACCCAWQQAMDAALAEAAAGPAQGALERLRAAVQATHADQLRRAAEAEAAAAAGGGGGSEPRPAAAQPSSM